MDFTGRDILVTGGDSGIGFAAVDKFSAAGGRVALLGHDSDKVQAAAKRLTKAGRQILPLVADVARPDQMQAALRRIHETWGSLHVLFANAGINGVWAPLDEIQPEEWDRTVEVNLKGTYLSLKYALPLLRREGGSVIVNASVNGNRIFSNAGATCYACTKAALVAFAKMQALEQARHRVRVNAICPGYIETSIEQSTRERQREAAEEPVVYPEGKIPLTDGRPGSPEQVADLVMFLASPQASHISGSVVYIDGAESLLQG